MVAVVSGLVVGDVVAGPPPQAPRTTAAATATTPNGVNLLPVARHGAGIRAAGTGRGDGLLTGAVSTLGGLIGCRRYPAVWPVRTGRCWLSPVTRNSWLGSLGTRAEMRRTGAARPSGESSAARATPT